MRVTKGQKHQVEQFTLEGVYLQTFESAKEASVVSGVSVTHIRAICNGSKKARSKFSWKYSEQPIDQTEIWKEHPIGVACSNKGRIQNKNIVNFGHGERNGYRRIKISGKTYSVHRLIAEAFLPNPEAKTQVNHIDRDRGNNKLTNLEWSTPSENVQHRYKKT